MNSKLVRGSRRAFGKGSRHLMVSLLLQPRSALVTSVALAPGLPLQLRAPANPWLAAVTCGGDIVHLSRVPDPFLQRGVRDLQTDPRAGGRRQGRAIAAVPFKAISDLTSSMLHILELSPKFAAGDDGQLHTDVLRRITEQSEVHTLDFDAITAAPQWATVGPLLGLPVDPARFEIYQDSAGLWRWRLRRAGGPVVAASSDGFISRAEAAAEAAWMRRHAAASPAISLG